jgi:hypothetical protein
MADEITTIALRDLLMEQVARLDALNKLKNRKIRDAQKQSIALTERNIMQHKLDIEAVLAARLATRTQRPGKRKLASIQSCDQP